MTGQTLQKIMQNSGIYFQTFHSGERIQDIFNDYILFRIQVYYAHNLMGKTRFAKKKELPKIKKNKKPKNFFTELNRNP